MTSKYLRKGDFPGRKFPGLEFKRKLSMLKSFEALGNFHVDKVTIVVPEYWEVKDWSGDDWGSKPQRNEKGKLVGYLHRRKQDRFEYQIFQSLGRNRNLQFNPRHFSTFEEFERFVESILQGKKYHISRVDFSWLLSKDYVSVSFLLWCIWRKGLTINTLREYEDSNVARLNPHSVQEFCIGKSNFRIECYDCDAYNSGKYREPPKRSHSCVNMEINAKKGVLSELGIVNLTDLKYMDFEMVLKTISFLTPSRTQFKNTDYEFLYKTWEQQGAGAMMKGLYEATKKTPYEKLEKMGFQPKSVRSGSTTLRKQLLSLAVSDWSAFVNRGGVRKRLKQRKLGYDMKPLFGL